MAWFMQTRLKSEFRRILRIKKRGYFKILVHYLHGTHFSVLRNPMDIAQSDIYLGSGIEAACPAVGALELDH